MGGAKSNRRKLKKNASEKRKAKLESPAEAREQFGELLASQGEFIPADSAQRKVLFEKPAEIERNEMSSQAGNRLIGLTDFHWPNRLLVAPLAIPLFVRLASLF